MKSQNGTVTAPGEDELGINGVEQQGFNKPFTADLVSNILPPLQSMSGLEDEAQIIMRRLFSLFLSI